MATEIILTVGGPMALWGDPMALTLNSSLRRPLERCPYLRTRIRRSTGDSHKPCGPDGVDRGEDQASWGFAATFVDSLDAVDEVVLHEP
jgi:hypothetical protein